LLFDLRRLYFVFENSVRYVVSITRVYSSAYGQNLFPAIGQYAENQRISAVRKIYQRGISTPMVNIESLWSDYCNYEKNINPTLAEKLISERNKEYQVSKKIAKQLETVTRGVNRQAVSVPPRGTAPEMKQVEMWKKYIQWEKSNPMETEEYGQFAKRG
ncbi:unnamed protein product, partial [Strongylus vulgaris]